MALNIRNPETEEMAAALARLTGGTTKTYAVTLALRERLHRLQRQQSARGLADELDELALHCAALPVLDGRSVDVVLSYDEKGLPN